MSSLSLMTFSLAQDLMRKTMSIEDTLRLAKKAGLPCVDVMRVKPALIPEYTKAVEKTGVHVYCYIAVVSFFEKPAAIQKNLEKELQTAKSLSAKLFMIVPYYYLVDEKRAKKLGREKTRQQMKKGFQMAVEAGKRFGLTVCFETTPQDDLCLSGTEDCRWMLQQVLGLGLVFDTANMLPHGDDPVEAYEALKDYIVHVHLKDVSLKKRRFSMLPQEVTDDGRVMEVTTLGQGTIPITQLYKRMQEGGYSGYYAIEYAHPKGGPLEINQHSEHLQQYLCALS